MVWRAFTYEVIVFDADGHVEEGIGQRDYGERAFIRRDWSADLAS